MKKLIAMLLALAICLSMQWGTVLAADYSGTITIIHVNDIHAYADETDTAIGYAKIAGYIDEVKKQNPNTLILDAGDTFAGNANASFDKGESVAAVLNTIGFDAMTAGNNDFMLGAARLKELSKHINYPMLAGNMKSIETGQSLLDGYTIVTLQNGMTVGIVGVTTPDSMATNQGTLEYENAIEYAKKLVAELRPKVSVLVGLVHLGIGDTYAVTSYDLANAIPEFDVIIDAHSHTVLETGNVVNGVLVVQTGEYSKNLGVVELTVANGKVTGAAAELVSKEQMKNAPERAETLTAVKELLKKSEAALSSEVGSTDVFLLATRDIVRTSETNMGNLFVDSMRDYTKSDVAIAVAGGIGGDIDKGPVTKRDILKIARVESLVVTMEVTGEDIVATLNDSVKAYPESSGSFLQVSGVKFKFDPSRTGDRVFDVTVNGAAIDLKKKYTVACFAGMSGNAGLKNGKVLEQYANTDAILEWYFEKNSPVNPQTEGRIVVSTKPAVVESFSDITKDMPSYAAISSVIDAGLFCGATPATFAPNNVMTREMLATVLGRFAVKNGQSIAAVQTKATDVKAGSWYAPYVSWAFANKIMNAGDKFGVGEAVTGEELATVITDFAKYLGIDAPEVQKTKTPLTRSDIAQILAAML